ncbi:MAG: APC family permease [Cyclobacteriaceae bacterium]|nr:amino acid permease [Flammeovirgaceae bacterium]
MPNTKNYTLTVATALVMANMVGTGVFTSLGYQVGPLPSGFVILVLWFVGGVVALSGALAYAEIASTLKKSGGEYTMLTELAHPSIGFLAGWTSFIAGFAGAISAVAIAIGEYATELTGFPVKVIAIAAVIIVTIIHWFGVRSGGMAQNLLTSLKISLIGFFCLAPFFIEYSAPENVRFVPQAGDLDLILSVGFATSLVFVVYAYTGWNAASYIAGNLENPGRNLPRALLIGTLAVVVIYLALNAMFLSVGGFEELKGRNDIGNVVAFKLFGSTAGKVFAGLFSFALLSTLSAMTVAGPRVTEAMGNDYPALRTLSKRNTFDMPVVAIGVQSGWAIFLILVSSFTEIISYISVSLSMFSMFATWTAFRLRKKYEPVDRAFSMPWFPLPIVVFTIATGWMMYFVFTNQSFILWYVVGSLLPGLFIYWVVARKR